MKAELYYNFDSLLVFRLSACFTLPVEFTGKNIALHKFLQSIIQIKWTFLRTANVE